MQKVNKTGGRSFAYASPRAELVQVRPENDVVSTSDASYDAAKGEIFGDEETFILD